MRFLSIALEDDVVWTDIYNSHRTDFMIKIIKLIDILILGICKLDKDHYWVVR